MADRPPLRVLIADDELLARQRIEDLLQQEPDVEIAGFATSGTDAVRKIRELRPDLVFLDVQMPGMTGLEVVREIGVERMPPTIFATAFDSHAIDAFDLAAIDYLVKPFEDERFEQAFRRARRTIELEEVDRLKERLLAALQGSDASSASAGEDATPATATNGPYLERIAVETRGKVRVVPVAEIDFIVASGPYAELHAGERRHLIREAMTSLEERLDPERFLRIHRSIIVRIDLVEALLKGAGGDYEVQLKDGRKLRVSRSRREELERRLGVSS
jgi:two-component system, LytTR family, response regulator